MEILTGYNPNLVKVKERIFYVLSPVTKSFESSPTSRTNSRAPRMIDERDLGSLIHAATSTLVESRFRNVGTVMDKFDPLPYERIIDIEKETTETVYPEKTSFQSERWDIAYGRNRRRVIERAAQIGLQLIAEVQATDPDQYLVSELRFMASMKARANSAKEILKNPSRMHEALQDGEVAVVPHIVDIAKPDGNRDKSDMVGYTAQAIPDVVGFSARTPDAQLTRRRLMKMIYPSNESNKRFMLDPELLETNKALLLDVMKHMLNGDMRVSVTEIKTNSWSTKSLVDKSNDEVYESYKHDVGHTLLVLMNVFRAVAPGAFRGREGRETVRALLNSTDVHIGVVDFPALYSSWIRRIGHIVPKQPRARLITLSSDQVFDAGVGRLEANRKYCFRHQAACVCV